MKWRLFKQARWKTKKGFKHTFKFSNNDINKLILLLGKGA